MKAYTKQRQQEVAAKQAKDDLDDNTRNMYDGSAYGTYVRPFKQSGLRDKAKETKDTLDKGPKTVHGPQTTTPSFPSKNDVSDNWKEIKQNSNGTFTTKSYNSQVTPGKWRTK